MESLYSFQTADTRQTHNTHWLFKEVFPLIDSFILNQINMSLLTGYIPQAFKVAVFKPLLQKPTLDPEVLAD